MTNKTLDMRGLLRFDSAIEFQPPRVTADGFIEVDGVVATTKTLRYKNKDGSDRLEAVPAETLRASAESLVGAPVTLGHPPGQQFLSPKNIKQYIVGTVLRADFDEESEELRVTFRIFDEEAIDAVVSRRITGLSPGYYALHEDSPEIGIDAVQAFREYNHLAIVKGPRGGPRSSIRLDEAGHAIQQEEETQMDKELQGQLDALQKRVDSLEEENDGLRKSNDELEAKVAVLEVAREDEEEVDLDEEPETPFHELFKQHSDALEVAKKYGVKIEDNASTEEIRETVAREKLKERIPADASEEFINAAFVLLADTAPDINSNGHMSASFSRSIDRVGNADDSDAWIKDLADPNKELHNKNKGDD